MTRCFAAFEFEAPSLSYPRETVAPAHRLLSDGQGWPVRLIRPENGHVTVLFKKSGAKSFVMSCQEDGFNIPSH